MDEDRDGQGQLAIGPGLGCVCDTDTHILQKIFILEFTVRQRIQIVPVL